MALTTFLRINLPYGLSKTHNGEWYCFNREYLPLGWNTSHVKPYLNTHAAKPYSNIPIHTRYKITERQLLKLSGEDCDRDENGKINRFWLYGDATFPCRNAASWKYYIEKLKILSTLEVIDPQI